MTFLMSFLSNRCEICGFHIDNLCTPYFALPLSAATAGGASSQLH